MITPELKRRFVLLSCDMEPENVHMDGEATPAQARERWQKLDRQWAALERQAGRQVNEREVWTW